MTNTVHPTSLILRLFPIRPAVANGIVNLFCLPSADASAAMYAAWHDTAAAWLDVYPVEYPGHGSRIREQLVHKPDSMAAEIAEGLLSLDSKPFALFGHSMGTVVTWKVMREVQRRGEIHRLRLIALSGRPVPSRLPKRAPRYKLPTEQFLVEVERYNGLPKEIYQYPELLELYLPILRNDFRIADEGYDDPGIPIPVPVITFSGEDDPDILPGGMEGWATHSEQWLGHYIFPGHHFYLAETQVRHEILRFMEKHLMK